MSACPRRGGPGPGPGHRRRLLPRVVAPPPPDRETGSGGVTGSGRRRYSRRRVAGGPPVTSNDLVCQTGATCGRRRRLARREGHDRAKHGWRGHRARLEGGTELGWRGWSIEHGLDSTENMVGAEHDRSMGKTRQKHDRDHDRSTVGRDPRPAVGQALKEHLLAEGYCDPRTIGQGHRRAVCQVGTNRCRGATIL